MADLTGVLITARFFEEFGNRLHEAADEAGLRIEPLVLDNAMGASLASELRSRVNIAFLSGDLQRGNTRGFMETISDTPNLRWLQSFGVGIDAERFGPYMARGVRLTNAAGVNSVPIAQHALTGLLILARRFPFYMEGQRLHEWRPINWDSPEAPEDLDMQTMVIVGLGAVGSRIAHVARALGLKVIGVRRRPQSKEDAVDQLVQPAALDEVLPRADWIVLSCTLTEETRGLMNGTRLKLLPRGARLINVSRGAVVDEDAMIEALREGRLGGAYLDVMRKEPLPVDSPLWDMPNVIITPHNAAASRRKFGREGNIFLENLVRWGKGQSLINEVLEI